jgi:ADP-ribose pyrophosphatase YjhB (NUDIX family)
VNDPRRYPERPYLAVSAAIFRNGQVLLVRRARSPSTGLYTLPGGVVELGETLHEALVREVEEETSMLVAPIALAGYRNVVIRDGDGKIERHFVVLPFAARWVAGEFTAGEELAEAIWTSPREVARLETTEGLPDIVTAAFQLARTGATPMIAP